MPDTFLNNKLSVIPIESIGNRILLIRGQKVMLDRDLALLYGVKTKVLNQAVKRNNDRFPYDFMFQLTSEEVKQVVTICDHLVSLKFSSQLPYAFTEHGVAMRSSVLRSKQAVQMNLLIIRAFIKIREILSSNKELAQKIEELQKEQKIQNRHINAIYQLLEKLLAEPPKKKVSIGFGK